MIIGEYLKFLYIEHISKYPGHIQFLIFYILIFSSLYTVTKKYRELVILIPWEIYFSTLVCWPGRIEFNSYTENKGYSPNSLLTVAGWVIKKKHKPTTDTNKVFKDCLWSFFVTISVLETGLLGHEWSGEFSFHIMAFDICKVNGNWKNMPRGE